MDGHFLIHDPAGLAPIGVGLHVALGHIDLFHHNRVMLVKDLQDLADLALILASDDHYFVILADTKLFHDNDSYRTSGARDTIFMKFLARSSRATGPKIRVPTGSPCLESSTAALESNLM